MQSRCVRHLICLAISFFAIIIPFFAEGADSLWRAHAHNDYQHSRPLFDALDEGFGSVEADILLVSGSLLVAHDRTNCQPSRTLENLYLKPLLERVRKRSGIYSYGKDFVLWIDIKLDFETVERDSTKRLIAREETMTALEKLLKQYDSMLTVFTTNQILTNAVTIILTGAHSEDCPLPKEKRLACFDSHHESGSSNRFELAFSDNWSSRFTWRGDGPMPDVEKKKLRSLVQTAHRYGKRVRFWNTPDRPEFWKELLDAEVDWIGTDRLKELAKFLKTQDK